MKTVKITDILLTTQMFETARKLHTEMALGFATECAKAIISPNLAQIEARIGQECDVRYLAYVVEHYFNELARMAK